MDIPRPIVKVEGLGISLYCSDIKNTSNGLYYTTVSTVRNNNEISHYDSDDIGNRQTIVDAIDNLCNQAVQFINEQYPDAGFHSLGVTGSIYEGTFEDLGKIA